MKKVKNKNKYKTNRKHLITIQELSRILLLDDQYNRSIYSYIKDKIIKPEKDSIYDEILFDREQIFKILGFKKEPKEPLINSIEASKIVGVKPELMSRYVKRCNLPHYRIKNVTGAKIYYLRSELNSAIEYKTKWDNGFPDFVAKNYFLRETMKYIFNSKIISGLKVEEYELLNQILFEGKSLKQVADEKHITGYHLKRKFILTCKRVYYAVMILESKLNNIKLTEEQNRVSDDKNRILTNKLQEEKQLTPSQININDAHLLHIYQLSLSHRAERILKELDIKTLYELADLPRTKILYHRDIGRKTILELETILKQHNLWWKDNPIAIDINSVHNIKTKSTSKPPIKEQAPLTPLISSSIAEKLISNTNIKDASLEEDTITKINKCILLSQLIALKKKFTRAEVIDPTIIQEYEAKERQIKQGIYDERRR